MILLLSLALPAIAQEAPEEPKVDEKASAGEKAVAEEAASKADEKAAQKADEPEKAAPTAEERGDLCPGGVGFDDGGPEIAYGFVKTAKSGVFVQRFETSLFPSKEIEKVCLCIRRGGSVEEADFEVVFYEEQGGKPADEPYASVTGRAEQIPFKGPNVGRFYPVEIKTGPEEGAGGVLLRGDATYIGFRFNPSVAQRVAICADKSEGTKPVLGFQKDDRAKGWDNLLDTRDWLFDEHKTLMIRAKAKPNEKGESKKAEPEAGDAEGGEKKVEESSGEE